MNQGQVTYPLLPDPPLLAYYFLESPWQVLFLLMVCGLILIYQGLQTRKKKLGTVGVILLALCIPLLLVSQLVKTARETVIDQARLLISHTAPLDLPKLKSMLSDECKLYRGTEQSGYTLVVPEISNFGEETFRRIIRENNITRIDAAVDTPTSARTQLWLKTYAGLSPNQNLPPTSTRWEFHWTLHDGQWKVDSVRWIESEQPFGYRR